jgi:hypothetical protein
LIKLGLLGQLLVPLLLRQPGHLRLGHLHGTLGHLWIVVQPIFLPKHATLEEALQLHVSFYELEVFLDDDFPFWIHCVRYKKHLPSQHANANKNWLTIIHYISINKSLIGKKTNLHIKSLKM